MSRKIKRSFLGRVRDALPDLHPAERRLGDFLCDFPGELASYSASELAQLANVSNATVSRFVQRLGYENYEEARRHAREEKATGSRLFLAATAGDEADTLQAQIAQAAVSIERTFIGISGQQIDEAARAILDARKVWVMGFRASHSFATYLHWQTTQVIENIVAIPGGGQTLGEHLVSVKEEDCVIVYGLRRRIARMNNILAQIQKTGARLLYITDEGAAFYPGATWHFRCQTHAPGPLFSHISVMALTHILATRIIEFAGGAGKTRLRGIEVLNDRLDEL